MRVQFKKNWIESSLSKWKEQTDEVLPKFAFYEQQGKNLLVKQKWEVLSAQKSTISGERLLDEWFMRQVLKKEEQDCNATEVTEHLSQPDVSL